MSVECFNCGEDEGADICRACIDRFGRMRTALEEIADWRIGEGESPRETFRDIIDLACAALNPAVVK